jgi:hypothetical protein
MEIKIQFKLKIIRQLERHFNLSDARDGCAALSV